MVSFFSKAWFLCDRPDLPTGTIGTIMWKPGLIETNFGLYSNSLRTARPEIHLLFSGYHNSNYSYKEIPCARSTGTFALCALQPLSTPIYFFSYISTKERRCFFSFYTERTSYGQTVTFCMITRLLRTNMEINTLVFLLSIEHP